MGSRTTLDVLDAEQTLSICRCSWRLPNAIHRPGLSADCRHRPYDGADLGLNVVFYDVEQNYLDVRYKWIGTNVNTVD